MPIIINPSLPEPTPPETIVSPDGILTARPDNDNAGVLLLADFTGLVPTPDRVEFTRTNPDGTIVAVRSGDPAYAPGGYAIAYDDEAPLGVGVSWHATPITRGVQGDSSEGVAMELAVPTGLESVWIKALDAIDLSMLVHVESWTQLASSGQSSTAQALGTSTPQAIVTGPMTAPTSQLVAITDTNAQRDQMAALLNQGIVFVETNPDYGRPDAYELIGDVTEDIIGPATSGSRRWTINFTEVARPDTAEQRLRVPGRTYATRLAAYPTYSDVPDRTYAQALTG